MRPLSVFRRPLLVAAALAALLAGCGKNLVPTTVPPSTGSAAFPTYTLNNFIGAGNPVSMNGPLELAVYGNEVWETDYNTNSVLAWSTAGLLSTSVSVYGAPTTHLSSPWGLGVGPDGYLYACDQNHRQVVEFTPTGQFVTVFGNAELGANTAIGIAVNATTAYMLGFNPGVIYAYTIAGSGPAKTFTASATIGNSGPATLGGFPYGLCLDNAGNIYVADDTKTRVAKFSPNGAFQMAVTAGLTGTRAVVVDSQGNIFAENNPSGLIDGFRPDGTPVTEFGDPAGTEGIAIDGQGNLYEALYGSNLVAIYRRN